MRNPILIGQAEEVDLVQPQVRGMLENPGVYIAGDTARPGYTVVLVVQEPGTVHAMSPDDEPLPADRFLETLTLHGPYQAASVRPLSEWHEDDGPVTWWKFPVDEPAWIGSPTDSDWPGYHTHWTPHPPVRLEAVDIGPVLKTESFDGELAALRKVAEHGQRLRLTAPVDDDFPEMMHNFDSALRHYRELREKEGGRG
jgi:hypothetical protein